MQNKFFGLHYDITKFNIKQRLGLGFNFNLIQ